MNNVQDPQKKKKKKWRENVAFQRSIDPFRSIPGPPLLRRVHPVHIDTDLHFIPRELTQMEQLTQSVCCIAENCITLYCVKILATA